jgi:anti-sigma-K factor RskA
MSPPTPGAPHVDVAGWLLGALDANEAAAFEAHLASCPECQAEVERLRPTVTLLSTAAQDIEVPPLLADRTVAAVRDTARRRQRRNWTVRALVAAAVVALLTLGAVALFTRSSAETFDFAMSSPNGGPAAGTATAHHTNRGWSIQLSLHGLPALNERAFYECWYVNPAKDSPAHPFRVTAGTFDANDSGKADVQMWSWADPQEFPIMQITVEPADGNPAPSQNVMLTGVGRRH